MASTRTSSTTSMSASACTSYASCSRSCTKSRCRSRSPPWRTWAARTQRLSALCTASCPIVTAHAALSPEPISSTVASKQEELEQLYVSAHLDPNSSAQGGMHQQLILRPKYIDLHIMIFMHILQWMVREHLSPATQESRVFPWSCLQLQGSPGLAFNCKVARETRISSGGNKRSWDETRRTRRTELYDVRCNRHSKYSNVKVRGAPACIDLKRMWKKFELSRKNLKEVSQKRAQIQKIMERGRGGNCKLLCHNSPWFSPESLVQSNNVSWRWAKTDSLY